MEQNEPAEPDAGAAGPPGGSEPAGPAHEALRRLEERLERASDAAERLFAEAAARAAAQPAGGDPTTGGGPAGSGDATTAGAPAGSGDATTAGAPAGGDQKPPPSGWQMPRSDEDRRAGDLELLANLLQSLRDLIPPELQRRLAEALRELLLALRALIDWYLERVEQRRRTPAEVQDIPIL
jgi:hypothetical protein